MLDKVAITDAFRAGRCQELTGRVPLMIAGEDNLVLVAKDAFFICLLYLRTLDEVIDQLGEAGGSEDFLPEVGYGITTRVGMVTCTEVAALIERQELGLFACKAGRHVDLLPVDGEVDERTLTEGEQGLVAIGARLTRITVLLVLFDRVLDRLLEAGLQFEGHKRQTVHKEHQVDTLLVMHAVVHLLHHSVLLCREKPDRFGVHTRDRLALV